MTVRTIKILKHPCFQFIELDHQEHIIDKLQKLKYLNRNKQNVDLLLLMREKGFIQPQLENKCKMFIKLLDQIPLMRCLWERPPENSEDPFRPFRNRYTQTRVSQMTRKKTEYYTENEFHEKFQQSDLAKQALQSIIQKRQEYI